MSLIHRRRRHRYFQLLVAILVGYFTLVTLLGPFRELFFSPVVESYKDLNPINHLEIQTMPVLTTSLSNNGSSVRAASHHSGSFLPTAVRDDMERHHDMAAVTNNASSSTEKTQHQERQVYFLNHTQLSQLDGFSASWLQSTHDFLSMNLDDIGICEDASFMAYSNYHGRESMMRMTMDWLDFSLEHLSKWWKILRVFENDIPYNSLISKLEHYIAKGSTFPLQQPPIFERTIAIIAFQACTDDKGGHSERASRLTILSLGATIESLRRAGFGRVVVVGMEETDAALVLQCFQYLRGILAKPTRPVDEQSSRNQQEHQQQKQSIIVKYIGHMEVAFAKASKEDGRTVFLKKNMPKAALMGLRRAFKIADKDPVRRTFNESRYTTVWLGETSHHRQHRLPTTTLASAYHWQYVYLTEPDSILHTRPTSLKQLKAELDQGTVLIPHRLQPIPHESDVRGYQRKYLYLPGHHESPFDDVHELDVLEIADVCCDEHKGPDFKPGLPPHFPKCGTQFWYMCDFNHWVSFAGLLQLQRGLFGQDQRHQRLKQYPLMRLQQGTGIVSLAGSEHGRRCLPRKANMMNDKDDIACRPPP